MSAPCALQEKICPKSCSNIGVRHWFSKRQIRLKNSGSLNDRFQDAWINLKNLAGIEKTNVPHDFAFNSINGYLLFLQVRLSNSRKIEFQPILRRTEFWFMTNSAELLHNAETLCQEKILHLCRMCRNLLTTLSEMFHFKIVLSPSLNYMIWIRKSFVSDLD